MGFRNYAKAMAPWKRASRRPGWAFGLAVGALVLLAGADFVMLGDALGQSFGGILGYVVVVALLAGFVFLPRALALLLHSLIERRAERATAGEGETTRKNPADAVKAVICLLLLATTIASYVAVTDFRLSQARANEAVRQQTEELQSSQQADSRIVISQAGDSTQASAESQTLLLTVILVATAVYSFALTWARATEHDDRLDRIAAILPRAHVEAEREAERCARERGADLLQAYSAARAAVDATGAALEGSRLLLRMVECPAESPLAATAIRTMVDSARQAAPLPKAEERSVVRRESENEAKGTRDANVSGAHGVALERLVNSKAPKGASKVPSGATRFETRSEGGGSR